MTARSSIGAGLAAALIVVGAVTPARAVIETAEKRGSNYADPAKWPTLLVLGTTDRGGCSAVAVGQFAVLTAASCVHGSKDKRVKAVLGERALDLDCTAHPEFDRDPQADFALCKPSAPLPLVRYERIGIKPPAQSGPVDVTMLGFGCLQPLGLDFGFGRLTEGAARLLSTKEGMMQALVEGSVLCAGDGGGATFAMRTDPKDGREIVGVNSVGDAQKTSFIGLVSSPAFLAWAKRWSDTNRAPVCGLDGIEDACFAKVDETARPLGAGGTRREPAGADGDRSAGRTRTVATPATLVVSNFGGETLRQVVERSCGTQPNAYYTYVLQLVASGRTQLKGQVKETGIEDFTFSGTGEIEIPRCVPKQYTAAKEEVTPKPGESPVEIYKRTLGAKDFERTEPTVALWKDLKSPSGIGGAKDVNSPYFDGSFAAFNKTVATMPQAGGGFDSAARVIVPVKPGVINRDRPEELWRDLGKEPRDGAEQFHNRAQTTVASLDVGPVAGPGGEVLPSFQPIFALSDTDAKSDCVGGQPGERYPYDVDAVAKFMAINKAARKQLGRSEKPVTLLIADNGLRIEVIEALVVPQKRRDPLSSDPLDSKTDVTYFGDGKYSHGTQVTSLAFGGQQFLALPEQDRPEFRLTFSRIYEKHREGWTHASQRVRSTVAKAGSTGGIVNMSFSSVDQITAPQLSDIEAVKSSALFVVAAGNLPVPSPQETADVRRLKSYLSPTIGRAQFPALFGGAKTSNVITVASSKANGDLAGFSFWNRDYVDIAAPGCGIPALTFDRDSGAASYQTINGTSASAPLVTFAAALVKWELGSSVDVASAEPAAVKRRLLVASDLNPSLALKGQVADGRLLNIPKAIASLYYDVLELKADGKLRQGDVVFMSKEQAERYAGNAAAEIEQLAALDVCGEPLPLTRDEILKLTPGYKGLDDDSDQQHAGTLVYYKLKPERDWDPEKGRIRRKICKTSLAEVRVGFRDREAPSNARYRIFKLGDVRDVVMREARN